MSIEIWDWGLGYIYLWDVLIAWWWKQDNTKTYEFDMTNNAWWTLTNATISNWKLQWTTWNAYWEYNMWDITQATKITIDIKCYWTTWSWIWVINSRFENTTDNVYTWICLNYMTNNWYNQSWLKFANIEAYNSDNLISTTTKYWSWVETMVHWEIDITNKTATFKIWDTVIWTTTIPDSNITKFRTYNNWLFRITLSATSMYVSYLKVKIEF